MHDIHRGALSGAVPTSEGRKLTRGCSVMCDTVATEASADPMESCGTEITLHYCSLWGKGGGDLYPHTNQLGAERPFPDVPRGRLPSGRVRWLSSAEGSSGDRFCHEWSAANPPSSWGVSASLLKRELDDKPRRPYRHAQSSLM